MIRKPNRASSVDNNNLAQFPPYKEWEGMSIEVSEHISHTQRTYNGNKLLFIKTIHHAFRSTKPPPKNSTQNEWNRMNFYGKDTKGRDIQRYIRNWSAPQGLYIFNITNISFLVFFVFVFRIQSKSEKPLSAQCFCNLLFMLRTCLTVCCVHVCIEIIITNFFSLLSFLPFSGFLFST